MIRFVTYRNFPVLDLQIEEAYRRRCDYGPHSRGCLCLADVEEINLLRTLREARRRSDPSRTWLRQLAFEMDGLASSPEPPARRRASSRLIAANAQSKTSLAPRKRRRGGSR